MLRYCANLKAIRYESTSLNRIAADKSHRVIAALLRHESLFPIRMVLYHFNRYPLGLISTYLCTYHRTEEFIIALANYVVSSGVQITYRPDNFVLTFYNR